MKNNANSYRKIIAVIGVALLAAGITRSSRADSLYVGDAGDNTVKRYDPVSTGTPADYVGTTFVSPTKNAPLAGPRGLILNRQGELLVVNQNVDKPYAGEVYRYDGQTGSFLGALIPAFISPSVDNPNAPFAPRGMVLGGNLYVASQEADNPNTGDGKLRAYTKGGKF